MEQKTGVFPKDFIWGIASSAGQTEGAIHDDGRSPSIWDTFSAVPGNILNGDLPSVSCDSYHRYLTDVENLSKLGVDSYRFSISWSRVMPDGTGWVNPKGVDFYKRLTETLLNKNIKPHLCLYHWDLPQVLEDRGGLSSRDFPEWFSEYALNMYRVLGDIIPMWSTVNEPIAAFVGYGLGELAPGSKDIKRGYQAAHNLLVAHGKAVKAFRSVAPPENQIGIIMDIWKRYPLRNVPEDIALAKEEDETNWKFYLDPVLTGQYSDYIIEKLTREGILMDIGPHDLELISTPLDFFGVNIYNRVVVSEDEQALYEFRQGKNFFSNGTEIFPQAMYDNLKILTDDYKLNIPLYVSENGTFGVNEAENPVTNIVEDDEKIAYMEGCIAQLARFMNEGYDVKGYYAWTLMDNFEWTAGYSRKYGLLKTNFETLERTWKKSAYWYRDWIRKNK